MAERRIVSSKVKNGSFNTAPSFTAATNTNNKFIDGTAAGSNDAKYGWMLCKGGTATAQFDSSVRYSGSNSMKLDVTVGSGGTTGQVVSLTQAVSPSTLQQRTEMLPIRASTSYTLRVAVKTLSVSSLNAGGVRIRALQYDGQSTTSVASASSAFITGTADWQILSITFTSAATARFVNIWLQLFDETGTVWFDDVSFDTTTPTTRTPATSRTTATNRVAVRDMGTALSFDGSGDVIYTPTSSTFRYNASTDSLTFSFLTKRAWNSTTTVRFLHKNAGNDDVIVRSSTNGNKIIFTIDPNAGSPTFFDLTSLVDLPANEWVRVTGTYNASTGGAKIYFNATEVASNSTQFTGTTGDSANLNWSIGADTGGGNVLTGKMDEVCIWYGVALSSSEVADFHSTGRAPYRSLLKIEYLCDEASGSTALDTSGNGNDGTITGATYTTDTPKRARTAI